IALQYKGMDKMKVDADGSLLLGHEIGFVTEGTPKIIPENSQDVVPVSYRLKGTQLTFDGVKMPGNKTFTIDPAVSWGLSFGGAKTDLPDDISLDAFENIYISGRTRSNNLNWNGVQLAKKTLANVYDAFLSKFDKDGHLLWCTYYGGPNDEKAFAVAVDPKTQEVFIGGKTNSTTGIAFDCVDDPVDFKMDATFGGGDDDGFIAKFTSDGQII